LTKSHSRLYSAFLLEIIYAFRSSGHQIPLGYGTWKEPGLLARKPVNRAYRTLFNIVNVYLSDSCANIILRSILKVDKQVVDGRNSGD